MGASITAGEAADFVVRTLRAGKVRGTNDNRTIHQAIQTVCSDFVLRTNYSRQLDVLSVVSGDATVAGFTDLALEAFEPHRVRQIWIDAHKPLEIVNMGQLLTLQEDCPRSGRPTKIAFIETDEALAYPTPNADFDINLLWSPPFTSWTLPAAWALPTEITPDPADDTSQNNVELNLPADVVKVICSTGVPAELMQFDPEHASFVTRSQQLYEAFVERMNGANSFSRKIQRTRRR